DRQLLQGPLERADGVEALEKGARRPGVLADPVLQARRDADDAERQQLVEPRRLAGDAEIERVRHQLQRTRLVHATPCASGSRPARRSRAQVRRRGKPISAVGSSESIASSRAMPNVSALALPAQSYGC